VQIRKTNNFLHDDNVLRFYEYFIVSSKLWSHSTRNSASAKIDALENDSQVTDKLDKNDLDTIFSYDAYTKSIPSIIDRALAE
jgi:hypothetical protein